MDSHWEELLNPLKRLILRPVLFNDLQITLVDAITAVHASNYEMGAHKHQWFELNYIISGEGYTILEGQEFLVRTGEGFLIPPGMAHGHRHSNFTGDESYCLRILLETVTDAEHNRTSFGEGILHALLQPRPHVLAFDWAAFVKEMDGLPDALLQLRLAELILSLCPPEDMPVTPAQELQDPEDNNDLLVRQAILYMKNDHSRSFSPQEMASSLYVSYRHLSRIFKELTGFTITQTLNEIKVEHAKKLLMEGSRTLRDIAREVGFENEYYLSRVFTQYAHSTPREFRKNYKEQIMHKLLR